MFDEPWNSRDFESSIARGHALSRSRAVGTEDPVTGETGRCGVAGKKSLSTMARLARLTRMSMPKAHATSGESAWYRPRAVNASLVGVEVLVLDANQRVRAGIERLLSEARLHVTCVANTAKALQLVERSGTTWSQQAYIKASTMDLDDRFGVPTALSADGSALAVARRRAPRCRGRSPRSQACRRARAASP
jgi:hypothetical protein